MKLTIGQASQTVEVTSSAVGINPDQATVQGVLTAQQISTLPINGRNNLFNFTYYDLPPNILTGLLTGNPGSINGTTQANCITNRVGLGTGVFVLGAPRAIEFGMRIEF